MSDEIQVAPAVPMMAKAKFLAIGGLIGLLIGGVGIGKVYMDMGGAVTAAQSQVTTMQSANEEQASKSALAIAAAEGQNRALKARVSADAALLNFNRQNYGSAGDHLKMVRTHLNAIDAAAHQVDAAALAAANDSAKTAAVDAAGDLTAQAETLSALGTRIDALIK